MNELDAYRNKIDEIDKKIISLLEERLNLVLNVKEYKKENNIAVLDENREQQVLNKVDYYTKNKVYSQLIKNTFISIMNESKDLQRKE
ncbi:chorismate mutase [Mycoplasma sp. P36-A1]|uniref:chorismate mutase n=1 Tax=Mycoplasma sp. P36-A1 TaxID=3252900 RepID=UPI003C2C9D54